MPILRCEDLSKKYGGLIAVKNLNCQVNAGTITSLIGPNGAGKSTVFNVFSGLDGATEGRVYFKNVDVTRKQPNDISAMGMARSFQTPRLFGELTVEENVMIGFHRHLTSRWVACSLSLPLSIREEEKTRKQAMEIMELVGIIQEAEVPAKNLPFGKKRLLEIARALATQPELLLLNEPAAGLDSVETKKLAALITRIRKLGVTVCLIEHDMNMVMDISDHVIVLHHGEKIAEGPPVAVQSNPLVLEAYLGGSGSYGK